METAGKKLAQLFEQLNSFIEEGMSTLAIEQYVDQFLTQQQMLSQTKGYQGYQFVSCISINDEVIHGVPLKNRYLQQGDLVKIDICAAWNGYCADMTRVFCIGAIKDQNRKLIETTQSALDKGIQQCLPGNRVGDISHAIEQEVVRNGFAVLRDYAGHGIGKKMHEDPEIPNYGSEHKGVLLQVGMVFAIEPMVVIGSHEVVVEKNGWTVRTVDGGYAVHIEDTVAITQDGIQIMTRW